MSTKLIDCEGLGKSPIHVGARQATSLTVLRQMADLNGEGDKSFSSNFFCSGKFCDYGYNVK